jgi:multiple sugar transport system permease protein
VVATDRARRARQPARPWASVWQRIDGRVVVTYVGAFAICVWSLFPLYWIVFASFTSQADLLGAPPPLYPTSLNVEANYEPLFANFLSGTPRHAQADFLLPGLVHSLIVGVSVAALTLIVGLPSAYAFDRLRFRGRDRILISVLLAQMVPAFVLIIPIYIIFRSVSLDNTLQGLTIAHLALILPFTIWILRASVHSVDVELEWAARMDGASRVEAIRRVVIPLVRPGLVTAGLLAFMLSWNEFFFALVLNPDPDAQTIQLAVAGMYNVRVQSYGVMAAGSVLAALPTIVITLIFQRYLVQGVLSGAVKA